MQAITHSDCKTILPDITDFLAGNTYESFDTTLNILTSENFTGVMNKRLSLISDRYLVISYKLPLSSDYNYAIVVDLVRQRYGKLDFQHQQVFELNILDPEVGNSPREVFALLRRDGKIYTVDFDCEGTPVTEHIGVVITGKYQYVRSRLLQLDTVVFDVSGIMQEVHVIPPPPDEPYTVWEQSCFLYDYVSLDGKTLPAAVQGTLISTEGADVLIQEHGFDLVGVNHSLLLKGRFNLQTLELHFNVHGQR